MAALEHQPNCDRNHTDRQPCNRAGAAADAANTVAVVRPDDAEAAVILEAPRSIDSDRDAPIASLGPVESALAPQLGAELAAPDATTIEAAQGKPAPSRWAIRAWEDTAAAVGDVAAPAPPPLPSLDLPHNDHGKSHTLLVIASVAIFGGTLLLFRSWRKGRGTGVHFGERKTTVRPHP